MLTDAIESPDTIRESPRSADFAERRQFFAEHGADAQAELLGLRCGRGIFGNDPVDDAVRQKVRRPDSLFGCHGGRVVRVMVEDRACPLGRKRGKPSVLCADDPIRWHKRERSAAGSLAEKH